MRVLLSIMSLIPLGLAPMAEAAPPTTILYDGQLQDASKQGVSGIYPLTFSLFRSQKSKSAAWSEGHYVAIDDGKYSIELGTQRPIPKTLKLDRVYLGVAPTGGKEFLREHLGTAEPEAAVEPPSVPDPATPVEPARTVTTTRRVRPTTKDSSVKYAEEAGFAYEAEKATTASKVGDLSDKDIRALVKSASSAAKAAAPRLGSSTQDSKRAGGGGGAPYSVSCPAGYVVTGIRGGAGKYVDSLTLICSPLE